MLYYILGSLALLIVGLLAFGMSKPNTFRVSRSILIDGPPEAVFAVLNDFHQGVHWSPWDKKDLSMKQTFSGSPTGVGAIHEWDGDKNVGQGRQEILESIPSSKLLIQLDFFRPFKGQNFTEYLMEPRGAATHVTWLMYGPLHIIPRILCLNMDKMIGKDFDTGLSNLKAYVEGSR